MKVSCKTITLLQATLVLPLMIVSVGYGYAQPAGETVNYTDLQAVAGKLTYERNCASCHGVNLEGAAVVPNLSGDAFTAKWGGAPLRDLATALRQMPPGNTDGLDERTYEELAAYILAFNGIPAAPGAAANTLSFQSNGLLPDMTGGQHVPIVTNITSGAAEVLERLSPVTDEMLKNPPAEDWLLWQNSYDNQGYSSLDQVNRETVSDLVLSWRMPVQIGENNPGPIIHDGIMFFFTFPDTVLAIDASNGSLLWRYQHQSDVRPSQKKGIALHGSHVYVPTSDLHVLALDAITGELIWDHEIETEEGLEGYHLRMAPMVIGDTVIQGITSLRVPKGGWILGINRNTGAQKWRFNTIPRPGEPGGNSWNGLPIEERSGGSVWNAGSYDEALNLVYFGVAPTYDTAPLLSPVNVEGITNDALYTNATIALNPDTGELVWYYQHLANDQWDLDWAFERQIVTIPFEGESRKAVINMGKLGILDALDAATGEYLFSMDMGLQNVVSAIDPDTGYKTINPYTVPQLEETRLICANHYGAKSWPPAAFNPTTNRLYLPLNEGCMEAGPEGRYEILTTGVQMRQALLPDSNGRMGRIQALDLGSQEFDWLHRQPSPVISSILATAGGLVFAGDLNRNFKALDEATGEVLWETDLDDIPSSTIVTYAVEDIQYVAIATGQTGYHVNDWARMYDIFAESQGMPVNDSPKGGAAIWVFTLAR
jgi:alcohol dehydrogenase (cytochrome c)